MKPRFPTMKLRNPNWLSADVQAHIEPPPIPLNRAAADTVKECDIIKIKMRRDPASATSDMYKLKIEMFENGKPEKSLKTMKSFKTEIDETGTTIAAGKTNYLRNLLHGEALREFDKLASQVKGTKNAHITFIK